MWTCVAADAMPRLGLCTTDPRDSNMLPLSLCIHSLMCRAGMVKTDGMKRIGTVIIRQLFFESLPVQFVGSHDTVTRAV